MTAVLNQSSGKRSHDGGRRANVCHDRFMCQYHPKCPTIHHRKKEACRYIGQGVRSASRPIPQPATPKLQPVDSRTPGEKKRSQAATQTSATAGGDLVLWLILAAVLDDRFWLVALGIAAVGIPAALAGRWAYECSAWVKDASHRCKNPRPGWLRRCQHHQEAGFTAYDAAAVFAATVAVINVIVFFNVLT